MTHHPRAVYVDTLSTRTLRLLSREKTVADGAFYLGISPRVGRRTEWESQAWRGGASLTEVHWRLSELRDAEGHSLLPLLNDSARRILFDFSDRVLEADPLILRLSRHFEKAKLIQFLQKALEKEVFESLVLVEVARQHAANAVPHGADVVLYMRRRFWAQPVGVWARRRGVEVVWYRDALDSRYVERLKKGLRESTRAVLHRLRIVSPSQVDSVKTSSKTADTDGLQFSLPLQPRVPRISVWYAGRGVDLDPAVRTELFWAIDSSVAPEDLLVYFTRTEAAASDEIVDVLNKIGIDSVSLSDSATCSSRVPIWRSTKRRGRMRRKFLVPLFWGILECLVRGRLPSVFVVVYMFDFVNTYSYWHDFFLENDVRVSVSHYDFTRTYMPKNLALRDLGGVSVSFQYSNLEFSSIAMSMSSDVLLSFGPAYRWVYEANRSTIDTLVYSGYCTDLAFEATAREAGRLRERLRSSDAEYIVALFDENSSDSPMSVISNDDAVRMYRFYLEWLLGDPSLGLILKPKSPKTLRTRIASVEGLMDQAVATGRCVLLEAGPRATAQYPCEAAQAADLSVGSLIGGTAMLEAHLTGAMAVFVDLEGVYSNPVYETGRDTIVFDDLNVFREVVERYRMDPVSVPGFGDLSAWAEGRDAFRDGKAASRIGEYIAWLMEHLREGSSREDTIVYANKRYAETCGAENVVQLRSAETRQQPRNDREGAEEWVL
ncbi:MAG: hypothetical protein JRE40_00465 [Deltaproteobacteria bacterium]|nr:hypothetical protein [Deltaproteobacteria bacterium]